MEPKTRSDLPAGIVTFLLSDIEGSTRLFHELGERYAQTLATHNDVLRESFLSHGGIEVDTQGDSFLVAFADPRNAVEAAVTAQLRLSEAAWVDEIQPKVRMGLHSGEAVPTRGTYISLAVNQVARVSSAAHGGQILISETTRRLTSGFEDIVTRRLGRFRLKGFPDPQELHQLCHPRLSTDFPPVHAVPARLYNFSRPRSSFVGREDELRDLAERLMTAQLTTLVGPGGTGKTRLAIEAALQVVDHYPDGTYFVQLSSVADVAAVAPLVAHTLGVSEEPGVNLLDLLVEHLARRKVLLLLDNCEHVLDGVVDTVNAILDECPDITVVATSREALAVAGAVNMPLSPLQVPTAGADPDDAKSCGAVVLFEERARSVHPAFSLTKSNVATVVSLVRKLDGLPLAVELAAARMSALSPAQLVDLLDRHADVARAQERGPGQRQQSLASLIDWSYEILSHHEQTTLRALSLFPNHFDLEAVEQLVGPGFVDHRDAADYAASLVEKSLITRVGEDQLALLETVKRFARLRLQEAGEEQDTYRRFVAWVKQLTSRRPDEDDDEWYDRIDDSYDELRIALDWCVGAGWKDLGLALCQTTDGFLYRRWHGTDACQWIETLIDLDGDVDPRLVAHGLWLLAQIANLRGELAEAESLARRAEAESAKVGDLAGIGRAKQMAGCAAAIQGDLDVAEQCFRFVRSLPRDAIAAELQARATFNLANLTLNRNGAGSSATVLFEEAIDAAEAGRDWRTAANAYHGLAMARYATDEPAEIGALLRQATVLFERAAEWDSLSYMLDDLACMVAEEDWSSAGALCGAACALREELHIAGPDFLAANLEERIRGARESTGKGWDAAFDAGKQLDRWQAIRLALRVIDQHF